MNQYYQPQKSNPYFGGAAPMQPAMYPQQAQPYGQFPPSAGFPQSGLPPIGLSPTPQQGIAAQVPGMLPIEQSYIENILRLNKGKLVTVHATFENNSKWNAQQWVGIIEAAGRDHLIISDPETGKRLLLPMVYLDFVTFEEEIDYDAGFGGLATSPPR